MDETALCEGPTGCGHPRSEHTKERADSHSACGHTLAHGRGTCACTRFKAIRTRSSDSKRGLEAIHG